MGGGDNDETIRLLGQRLQAVLAEAEVAREKVRMLESIVGSLNGELDEKRRLIKELTASTTAGGVGSGSGGGGGDGELEAESARSLAAALSADNPIAVLRSLAEKALSENGRLRRDMKILGTELAARSSAAGVGAAAGAGAGDGAAGSRARTGASGSGGGGGGGGGGAIALGEGDDEADDSGDGDSGDDDVGGRVLPVPRPSAAAPSAGNPFGSAPGSAVVGGPAAAAAGNPFGAPTAALPSPRRAGGDGGAAGTRAGPGGGGRAGSGNPFA